MATMTYLQAISSALRDELRADDRVLLMGEDIGVFGGAFKVTDGFFEEFGSDRVMDTPLAESAIIGCAVGAAVVGMRPVCEMQFADFISCGFDQLVNVAGKMHYRQGLAVPLVVRLPSGGGFSGGPFHSQNPEALFMHSPGIKVVAPSTAQDAKGLLHTAIHDPNPVCFMEHKHLYRRVKGEVADGVFETPFTARVARSGSSWAGNLPSCHLHRLLGQHMVTERPRHAAGRGFDRVAGERAGHLPFEHVALVVRVGRQVGEGRLRHAEVLGQHRAWGVLEPVGQQEGLVLGEVAVVEDEQELAPLLQSLKRVRDTRGEVP